MYLYGLATSHSYSYGYSVTIGNDAVSILSNSMREINIQAWSTIDEEAWPPEQPKRFTPLVLIQHQHQTNMQQSTAMAEFIERGHIDSVIPKTTTVVKYCPKVSTDCEPVQEVLHNSTITKEVAEILLPMEANKDPHFILIEGAPGMGKTLLLKEIACSWGKRQILQKFKFIIFVSLRDPSLHQVKSVNHFLQLFCKWHLKSDEIASSCNDYLLRNNGKDLVFLLDGYDEYPEILQKSSLIADLLKRKVLPCCGLIVSSRPHASVILRRQATIWIDILGFSEAERQHYIEHTMEDQTQKINELAQYLQGHSAINSLCFVPFNMVILVYIYKQGVPLPKNSTELYNYFIFLTICRQLAKYGVCLQNNPTTLKDLPEPYNKVVLQLARLSLEALNDNKLTFTLDEIKATCPTIITTPGALNGFGLLQVAKHFNLTGTTMTFNFLHLSIQEFLAAYYITTLSAREELKIIKEKFWSTVHTNMIAMYITITRGQRSPFKQFLSSGNKAKAISNIFLANQLTSFHLYRCFHEAGDDWVCHSIEQSEVLNHKKIDLSLSRLMATDMECVAIFLTSSLHKHWTTLNLSYCYIQDYGLRTLYQALCHCSNLTITELWLIDNGLTVQSSLLVSEITMKCKVKKLSIAGNAYIGEGQKLYSILTDPLTMLELLCMTNAKLSSNASVHLFTGLRNNSTLKELDIRYNDIGDDACDAIATALERNSCLVRLRMYGNPLTIKCIEPMLQALQANTTLTVLVLPECPENIKKKISSLQEAVNKNRVSRGCQVTLKIGYS